MISLDTMGLRLLLPTAVSIAIVVAAAVLFATREQPWPLLSTGGLTVVGTVPLPVAVLVGITLVLAWSFVLTGALHAHLIARLVGVGTYTAAGLWSAGLAAANSLVAAAVIALVVLSVVAAAIGLYVTDRVNHHQAPHLHHRVALRLPTFGWVLLATVLIYGLLALSGLQGGGLAAFMDFQLSLFSVLLVPVLVLAGTDFAEWAEVASGSLAGVLERLPGGALLGGLAGTAAAVLVWAFLVQGYGLPWAWRALLPVVLLALPVVVVAALARRRPASTRVPFWALAIAAVVLYAGLFGSTIDFLGRGGLAPVAPLPVVAASRPAGPGYWLLVPQGWRESSVPGGRTWSGSVDGRPARLVLLWGPRGDARTLSSALGVPVTLRGDGATGAWSAFSVTAPSADGTAAGEAWTRRAEGRTWVLAGLRNGGRTGTSDALFETVRRSWTADPAEGGVERAEGPSPSSFLPGMGAAAVLLLGLGLALLLTGTGEVATGGLFLALSGLFVAAGPWVAGGLLSLAGAGPDVQHATTLNLLFAAACAALPVAALTALVPACRVAKPVLRLLLALLLGFVCLQVLREGVYGTAQSAGERFTVVGGLVLLAAILWDLLMSGESFTNPGGLRVPRHTRVLLYLGYTLMVVAAVLFLDSEQVQGGGGTGYEFATELWPQVGISTLGPPLLLTFFLVNLKAWRCRYAARDDGGGARRSQGGARERARARA